MLRRPGCSGPVGRMRARPTEPRPASFPNQSQPAQDPQSALHNFVVTSNRQQYDAVTLAGNVMDEWESYLRDQGLLPVAPSGGFMKPLTARVEPFVERPTRAPTSRPRPGHGQRRRLPGRADRRAAIAASTTATGATDHVARLLRRRLLDGARGRPARRPRDAESRCRAEPGHRRVWRITRRAGAWPCWLLVEDVLADDLAMENGGQFFVLYRAETVVDRAPPCRRGPARCARRCRGRRGRRNSTSEAPGANLRA